MVFRPSFCAHCGESVERSEWRLWTSRRFCIVCESQFKGQDLIPWAIVIGSVLIGIFGFGTYLKSGPASGLRAGSQPLRLVEREAMSATPQSAAEIRPVAAVPSEQPVARPADPAVRSVPPDIPRPKVETAEPVYFCGAETKKGTPCARRVKGNTRCYQHVGMPAMVSADKLKFKQQ